MKIYHGHCGRVIVFKVLSGCWELFLSQTTIAPKFQKDLIIVLLDSSRFNFISIFSCSWMNHIDLVEKL